MTTPATTQLPDSTPLSQAGEFGLLQELLPELPTGPAVAVGPGDDAAVVKIGPAAVVSVDTLVEGVHFRRDWSSPAEIGRKAVAVNVSDLNAMAAKPVAMVMGFSAPGDVTVGWVREFMRGVVQEADAAGILLVGGDITRSRDITVAITVLGEADPTAVALRSTAKPGNVVAVCGRLGWAAAGLAVLGRGFRSPRAVVDAQRVPDVPYGQGIVAAQHGATAMIDISDGLLGDLAHICERSHVSIDVDATTLTIPEPLQAVAAATGKDPLAFVLTGGEDHALAATFPNTEAVPVGWTVIGRVLPLPDEGPTVSVNGGTYDGAPGWDHYHF